MRHLHVLGATGKARRETFDGREHLVVPVIALMEGVIHAVNAETPEFVPFAALASTPVSWNGRPVVLGHPAEDGKQIAANSPKVLESQALGTVFNARMDGKRLVCEAWIDIAKAKKIGAEKMLVALESGEMVEVSIGAFVQTKDEIGTFGTKPYKARWMTIAPEHLAMLPGGRGACSIEMGCGACRNAEEAVVLPTLHALAHTTGYDVIVEEDALLFERELGGKGSGNFGHEGRPGARGGSGDGDGDSGGFSPSEKKATLDAIEQSLDLADDFDLSESDVELLQSAKRNVKSAKPLSDKEKAAVKDALKATMMEASDDGEDEEANHYQSALDRLNGKTGSSSSNAGKLEKLHRDAEFQTKQMADNIGFLTGKLKQGNGETVDPATMAPIIKTAIRDIKSIIKRGGFEGPYKEDALEAIRLFKAGDLEKARTMFQSAAKIYKTAVGNIGRMKKLEAHMNRDKKTRSLKERFLSLFTALTKDEATTLLTLAKDYGENVKDCIECEGTGELKGKDCPYCKGTGLWDEDEEMPFNPRKAEGHREEIDNNDGDNDTMTKDERAAAIKSLTECSCSGFTAADIKTLESFPDALLTAQVTAMKTAQETETKLKAASEKKSQTDEEFYASAPASVRALIDKAKSSEEARKNELVEALKTAQDVYDETKLKALGVERLEEIAKLVGVDLTNTAVDFGGRPVVRAAEQGDHLTPPDPYAPYRKGYVAPAK